MDRRPKHVAALDVETGITDPNFDESLVKRAILDNASKSVVVATADKLGNACPFLVAPTTAVDVLVTDDAAPAAVVQALRAAGVEVVLVGPAAK